MTTGQAPARDTLSDDDDVYYCTGERLKLDARKGDGEWWCLSEEAERMTAVVHNVPPMAPPCSGTALESEFAIRVEPPTGRTIKKRAPKQQEHQI